MSASIRTHAGRVLDSYAEYRLLQLVCEKPTIYLREILSILYEETGMELSEATICHTLKRFGYTRKKVCIIANPNCYKLSTKQTFLHSETGCDKCDSLRKFGYALRGLTPKSVTIGKRVSAITAITTTKLLEYDILEGTVNGDNFYKFVQVYLPHVLPQTLIP